MHLVPRHLAPVLALICALVATACKTPGASSAKALEASEVPAAAPTEPFAEVALDPACLEPTPATVGEVTGGQAAAYEGLTAVQKREVLFQLHERSFAAEAPNGSLEKLLKNAKFSPPMSLLSGGNDDNPINAAYGFTNNPNGAKLLLATFKRRCDVIPAAEATAPKRVHALGSVAKIKFVIDAPQSPFSGLLQGAHELPALLRLSEANPVRTRFTPSAGFVDGLAGAFVSLEFIPGMAIKIFFDGKPSIDMIAMESLAGQRKDHNFFLHEFTNDFTTHAPSSSDPAIKARYAANPVNRNAMQKVQTRFSEALVLLSHPEAGPFNRTVKHMASLTATGEPVSDAVTMPERLIFVPNAELLTGHPASDPNPKEDFRVKLAALKPGDVLYTIKGVLNGQETILGRIELESQPLPSLFGDRQLFFRHPI